MLYVHFADNISVLLAQEMGKYWRYTTQNGDFSAVDVYSSDGT